VADRPRIQPDRQGFLDGIRPGTSAACWPYLEPYDLVVDFERFTTSSSH
jgi:hypothetical protein